MWPQAGVLGTADDIHDHTNTTTPFVDQNQTYTSHPSHQVKPSRRRPLQEQFSARRRQSPSPRP